MSDLTPLDELPESLIEYNRARYREEMSEAVFDLMRKQGVSREQLGKLFGCRKRTIHKILSGDADFRCDYVADLFLVLGRAPHLSLSSDLETLQAVDID